MHSDTIYIINKILSSIKKGRFYKRQFINLIKLLILEVKSIVYTGYTMKKNNLN